MFNFQAMSKALEAANSGLAGHSERSRYLMVQASRGSSVRRPRKKSKGPKVPTITNNNKISPLERLLKGDKNQIRYKLRKKLPRHNLNGKPPVGLRRPEEPPPPQWKRRQISRSKYYQSEQYQEKQQQQLEKYIRDGSVGLIRWTDANPNEADSLIIEEVRACQKIENIESIMDRMELVRGAAMNIDVAIEIWEQTVLLRRPGITQDRINTLIAPIARFIVNELAIYITPDAAAQLMYLHTELGMKDYLLVACLMDKLSLGLSNLSAASQSSALHAIVNLRLDEPQITTKLLVKFRKCMFQADPLSLCRFVATVAALRASTLIPPDKHHALDALILQAGHTLLEQLEEGLGGPQEDRDQLVCRAVGGMCAALADRGDQRYAEYRAAHAPVLGDGSEDDGLKKLCSDEFFLDRETADLTRNLVRAAMPLLPRCPPEHAANMMRGLAACALVHAGDPDDSTSFSGAILDSFVANVRDASQFATARMLTALANVINTPRQLFALPPATSHATARVTTRCPPKVREQAALLVERALQDAIHAHASPMADVLRASVALQLDTSQEHVFTLMAKVAKKPNKLRAVQCVGCVWALSVRGLPVSQLVLRELMTRVITRLDELDADSVTDALWSLACQRHLVDTSWEFATDLAAALFSAFASLADVASTRAHGQVLHSLYRIRFGGFPGAQLQLAEELAAARDVTSWELAEGVLNASQLAARGPYVLDNLGDSVERVVKPWSGAEGSMTYADVAPVVSKLLDAYTRDDVASKLVSGGGVQACTGAVLGALCVLRYPANSALAAVAARDASWFAATNLTQDTANHYVSYLHHATMYPTTTHAHVAPSHLTPYLSTLTRPNLITLLHIAALTDEPDPEFWREAHAELIRLEHLKFSPVALHSLAITDMRAELSGHQLLRECLWRDAIEVYGQEHVRRGAGTVEREIEGAVSGVSGVSRVKAGFVTEDHVMRVGVGVWGSAGTKVAVQVVGAGGCWGSGGGVIEARQWDRKLLEARGWKVCVVTEQEWREAQVGGGGVAWIEGRLRGCGLVGVGEVLAQQV